MIKGGELFMGKRMTNEEFLRRVTDLVGDEYSFHDKYTGRHNKMSCIHNVCGYCWDVEAGAFLGNKTKKGSRCPNCYGNIRKTDKTFASEVYAMYGNEYTVIDSYKNAKTKIKIKHNVCGHVLNIAPNTFLGGVGCAKCNGGIALTHSEVAKEIELSTSGDYILISHYTGCFSPIEIQHMRCGSTAVTTLALIRTKKRVPPCKVCYCSYGESLVTQYLTKNNIAFKTQVTFDDLKLTKNLSYDFFLPDYKVLIEYQGEQHYKPVSIFGGESALAIQKQRDAVKRDYAKRHGFFLIEIPYKFNTLEKVDSVLNTQLNSIK